MTSTVFSTVIMKPKVDNTRMAFAVLHMCCLVSSGVYVSSVSSTSKYNQQCGRAKIRRQWWEDAEAGESSKLPAAARTEDVQIEVSITSDALVEIKCRHKEGLLLDVLQALRKYKIEVTAVQSAVIDGVFAADIRAKIEENVYGKKPNIVEVKRAINQIIDA